MISVIIPVYKNKSLFIKNLEKNIHFLDDCQIIIVNDNPQEKLKKEIEDLIKKKKQIINLSIIENKKNLGFGQSINIGAKRAKGKYLMLLNSDVILLNKAFLNAIDYFKQDKNLFAVSFAQIEKNGKIVGKNRIFWEKGFYQHQNDDNLLFGETGWAEGGSCIIDLQKFNRLGGFNPIFSPFYWEDIDLSYQAKKHGFKIIFDPKIKVIHHHQATIGKYFKKSEIEKVAFCHQFLFTWKNIGNLKKLAEHLFFLPYYFIFFAFKGKTSFFLGFIQALKKYLLNK
jgi:GT2 family glycosyltransferase